MTNETNYRGKANAVFFAAVMVISMVAVGFAAAPAAAQPTGDEVEIDYLNPDGDVTITDETNPDDVQVNITNNNETDQIPTDWNATFQAVADGEEFSSNTINATSDAVGGLAAGASQEITFTGTGDVIGGLDPGVYEHRVVLENGSGEIMETYSSGTLTLTVEEADEQPDFDVEASNVNVVFQGQVVLAEGDNVDPNEAITLRSGSPDGDNSFVRQNTANNNGEVTFETSNLESDDYYIESSDGELVGDFEVTQQTFEGEFDPTEVDNAGEDSETTHEVETNRGGEFSVLVSAEHDGEAVDNDTLVNIIDGATDNVDDNEEAVRVTGVSDGSDLVADFEGQDAGNYSVMVEVEDTTAEANETITVNDIGEGEVSLDNGYVTVPQGDNAEITLEFEGGQDMGYVRIGELSEVGYEANITVDSNGEDNVTLLFNTYAAGDSELRPFVTVEDEDSDAEIVESETTQTPEDLDLLAMGTYSIEVDDSSLEDIANDGATDVGDLEIQERSVNEFNIWTTSNNALGELENADDVAAAAENGTLQQQSEIASGDVVVHELQATGLEGLVDTGIQTDSDALFGDEEGFLGTLSENETEGLDLRIRQTQNTTAPNSERKVADISAMAENEAISVIAGNDTYYLAFATDSIVLEDTSREVENGDAFETRLRIKDERLLDPNEDELDDGDISEFYQTTTATFSIEEAEGSIDGPVEVEAAEDQTITGETNVAPGNTLSLRARSNDDVTPGFVVSQSNVEVGSNGTFTAEGLDFSDASAGDNFTVTTRNSPFDEEAEAEGMVVEAAGNGTDGNVTDGNGTDGNVTDGTDGNVTDGDDGDDGNVTDGDDGTGDGTDGADDGTDGTGDGTDGTGNGTDGEDTGSEDGTPGFGAIVALVALIAAALLATRRRE